MSSKEKAVRLFVIGIFCLLYLVTSIISTVHVVTFFELSNSYWMAVFIAVAFELGAAASLASLVAMERMKMWIVWSLFILLTAMQVNGNLYDAFVNLDNFQTWAQLYGIEDQPVEFQKRVIAFVSALPLPLSALGFIKALVDYIRPEKEEIDEEAPSSSEDVDSGQDVQEEEVESEPEPKPQPEPQKEGSTSEASKNDPEEKETQKQDSSEKEKDEGVDKQLNIQPEREGIGGKKKDQDEENKKPYRQEKPR